MPPATTSSSSASNPSAVANSSASTKNATSPSSGSSSSTTTTTDQSNPIWIHAWDDALANTCAPRQCIAFCDINGSSDYKLCMAQSLTYPVMRFASAASSSSSAPHSNGAHDQHKLRIFRGTGLLHEIPLLEEPVALKSYYMDYKAPRVPLLAIASGSNVFLLKNLQPFYQFRLPEMEINAQEMEIWNDLRENKLDVLKAVNELKELKDKDLMLTKRSLEFLSLDNGTGSLEQREDLQQFVDERRNFPLKQTSVITCMEVLKKDKDEDDSVGCLVLGTEDNQVLVLDQSASRVLKTFRVPATPVSMSMSGKLDVDYRIIVSCRNGNVYTIKNDQISGIVIELESQPTDLVTIDKTILIGTMSNTIHCYHARSGKKQYSIYLPCAIKDMEVLDMRGSRNAKCLIVALENNELRVYTGKQLTNLIKTPDRVAGMRFGTYGSETNTLALTFANGALSFKFVARTAKLEGKSQTGPPEEQNTPLNLPKRTKLYIEQTKREKEYAVEMHRIFQRDLCKLRLTTAKAYVKILTDGQGPLSYSSGSTLRLNAQVQGLGPLYKIRLAIQNSGQRAMHGIPILMQYNQGLYTIERPLMTLPALVPNIPYKFTVDVKHNNPEEGLSEPINIFVCSPGSSIPIITAVVEMPLAGEI
uniref:Bardet-Biedl syndrome 1 N-terminal domain-containing protein n=1 Tax=Percolomonas cosmopolitus TaxID=63605 RepID=A0A7S1PG26_9EUKA